MEVESEKLGSVGKVWSFCRKPFWQTTHTPSSSSSSTSYNVHNVHQQNQNNLQSVDRSGQHSSTTVSSVAKSLLPTKRRLRLDPANKLYFPYEPGKQVRSAIAIENTCKSHVAFKFQTTAPKSCYMRPPGGVLAPGESIIATVFKFVEPPESNEKPIEQKSKVKFKIMSLKVQGEIDYVPELFDEQRDQVAIEQILRVIFVDLERPSPVLDKLKRMLAEADAALEVRKKPPEEKGPQVAGEGLVIDEWKERRERYLLAQQQVQGVDSV
ncbi:vesicle-associated protein 4-2-like [Vigna unguiculata]|uniref:Vesicle-associated membrane-protein-associated protein n=1 Tax=Vigna unguiculata TaxID=3917 RepID=A0A4D6NAR9_VIGUN|nr:vesicle-associated protein 4-2-like [Vigna unguiculata]XP_027925839.1 vesicle-associated protein 4-2-like [Vigna unguiculata]XP_027925840.1 vesicle-associated protein 4-2-like [Vigna unguiculata]QCE09629.1 Vesicle-associated membrane-protein-associated protein [Vigna unguiculata]